MERRRGVEPPAPASGPRLVTQLRRESGEAGARERARLDPRKRARPIAAGRLPVGVAVAAAIVLVVGGLVFGAILSRAFLVTALAYVVLLVAYSARLKHIVIVDVLVVAGGFVL